MNQLLSQHAEEVQHILANYPEKNRRSAVMPLLFLAQRQQGYINKQTLREISEIIGISTTDVASIVGFYSLFYDEPAGKYRIQVCTDLPCALRGAEEFVQKLCANLGIKVGETTSDGLITVEEVTCLAGCHHAPMFQVQGEEGLSYHEDQTVETALALVEELRKKHRGEGKA